MLAVTFLMGAHPEIAERAGRAAAWLARHVHKSIDPEAVGRSCGRLASVTRSALTGRAFPGWPPPTCPSTCSRWT